MSLPWPRGFDDLAQIGPRHRALCDRAGKRLLELGASRDEVEHTIGALRGIDVAPDGHSPEARSIVALAQGGRAVAFALATPVQDRAAAGTAFLLRPVLADLHENRHFRVLALSENQVELYEGDRWELSAVDALDVPKSMMDVVGTEIGRHDSGIQLHSSAARGEAAIFHGHGGADRGREIDRERFHHAVGRAVGRLWAARRDPLVLAADVAHQGAFRRAAELPGMIAEGVPGSPDRLSAAELRRRAWPVVERWRDAQEAERLAGIEGRLAHGRTTAGFEAVLLAALASQVDRAWIDREARVPGGIDVEEGTVRPAVGDEDVLDAIAAVVLSRGGSVATVAPGTLPQGASLAADLRGGAAQG